jgi:N-glycosylase/DNA lyase
MLSRADNSRSKLKRVAAPDFDLVTTLDSGQTFHWRAEGKGFIGVIGDEPVYVEQEGDGLRFAGGSGKLLAHYFSLDHLLNEICASFPNDPAMNDARSFCQGLRILRQPQWECLATFICSSMKQVAHIRQMSAALRQRFSSAISFRDHAIHPFPSARTIADLPEKELRACGLGYRAPNLLATARRIAAGEVNLDKLASLPDAELRTALCELPGVGAKVANCVMLFAYERLCAFPIDVWIARVLRERYFPRKRKMTERMMREFSQDYFGPHGGYAQQYLFHHARKTQTHRRIRPGRRSSIVGRS